MGLDKIEVTKRRRLIADLCTKGLHTRYSLRELAELLAASDDPERRSVNPKGKPWSHETIRQDVEAITLQWRQDAARGLGEHRAELAAQLTHIIQIELQKDDPDFSEVRLSVQAKAKLLGLDAGDVVVYEAVQVQMTLAVQRLRTRFGNDPKLLQEIYAALRGREANQGRVAN